MATSPKQPGHGPKRSRADLDPDKLWNALNEAGAAPLGRTPVHFVGLLAADDSPDHIRIYQDYELRTYVIVNRNDVLHRERVQNNAGVEVSLVFVDKEATVEIREVSSESFQADALSKALRAAEGGAALAASAGAVGYTPTVTPPISAAICTKIFCTNITCACTSRHSTLCSITCTEHVACPNPWTENWFCAAGSGRK